ncbi:MAG: tRNA lysidine(34) synthetase TilS [Bellilinea sp.]
MVDQIQNSLNKTCGLDQQSRLVIGVSGGVDSLALLHLLCSAGYYVIAAHFNHHLRQEAEGDAQFVALTARDLGCAFIRGDGDVAQMAATEKMSIEAAARKARYLFLFAEAEQLEAQAVITAHTADDQAETLLMHLIRGSGLNGLRGMQPRTMLRNYSSKVPLVRPLLDTWREELETYCRENKLQPRVDVTNAEPTYLRNRIRLELIPLLAGYNPRIKEHLTGLAANVRSSLEVLEDAISEKYSLALRASGEGFRRFDRALLATYPPVTRLEIIRKAALEILSNSEDIDRAALVRAATLLEGSGSGLQANLAYGLDAQVNGDRLTLVLAGNRAIEPEWPVSPANRTLELTVPGVVQLENGWEIETQWLVVEPDLVFDNNNPNTAILDGGSLTLPLIIRRRAPGDRFQPLGVVTGSLTVGDFFTNVKMPRDARVGWPLVFSGSQVIWVPGYRLAETAKVQKNSRELVRLRLLQKS